MGATINQNNFELLFALLLGQLDAVAQTGKNRVHHAQRTPVGRARDAELSIYDLSITWRPGRGSSVGTRILWYWSRHAMSYEAIVDHSVASIIRAVEGRSKKCLVLDLDNTLWGEGHRRRRRRRNPAGRGHAGGRGASGTPAIRSSASGAWRHPGDLLQERSGERPDRARHRESQLTAANFAASRINWQPKNVNLEEIAREIGIGVDSLVLLDDNPSERDLVAAQLPAVAVPDVAQRCHSLHQCAGPGAATSRRRLVERRRPPPTLLRGQHPTRRCRGPVRQLPGISRRSTWKPKWDGSCPPTCPASPN